MEEGTSFRSIDKHTARLANLERAQAQAASKGQVVLTQSEYVNHVAKLSVDLDIAWSKDERVASLRLAIQVVMQ